MSLDNPFRSSIKVSPAEKQTMQEIIPESEANNPIWEGSELPAAYVEAVIKPALSKINDNARIGKLMKDVETNSALKSLIESYTAKQFSNAAPSRNNPVSQDIKMTTSSAYRSAEWFIAGLADMKSEVEKENYLRAEIINRRRSIMAKFDTYVLQGDAVNKGNKTSYFGDDSKKLESARKANDVQKSIHDVTRGQMVTVLNALSSVGMDDNLEITFFGDKMIFDSKEEKLAFFASYLSAIEAGCDELIPSLLDKGIDVTTGAVGKVAKWTADTGLNILGDGVKGTLWLAWDHWFITAILITGIYRTGKAIPKSLLGLAKSLPLGVGKLIGWTAWVLWTAWDTARENMGKSANVASVWWDTPARYSPVTSNDLSNFAPGSTGENSHEEYRNKTIAEINKLRASIPALSVPPEASNAEEIAKRNREIDRRIRKFRQIDAEYAAGKISASEYVTRTESMMKWVGSVIVRDDLGNLKSGSSAKRAAVNVADRITHGAIESGTASVNAIAAAKKRMKWVAYSSVDLAGKEVKFENPAGKTLFEEFRDKIERYAQMQEWDANDRKRVNLEARRTQIQTIDIPAKQAEISLKSSQIAAAPHSIQGAPMMTPTGGAISTQIPNPILATLNTELSGLQQNLSQLNAEVNRLSSEMATLRGNTFAYVPNGNSREKFKTDIWELKTDLVKVIDKINVYANGWQPLVEWNSKALPDTFFNPKNLKIDKIRATDMVEKVLKR